MHFCMDVEESGEERGRKKIMGGSRERFQRSSSLGPFLCVCAVVENRIVTSMCVCMCIWDG